MTVTGSGTAEPGDEVAVPGDLLTGVGHDPLHRRAGPATRRAVKEAATRRRSRVCRLSG